MPARRVSESVPEHLLRLRSPLSWVRLRIAGVLSRVGAAAIVRVCCVWVMRELVSAVGIAGTAKAVFVLLMPLHVRIRGCMLSSTFRHAAMLGAGEESATADRTN